MMPSAKGESGFDLDIDVIGLGGIAPMRTMTQETGYADRL
jgi:hypothetical protein